MIKHVLTEENYYEDTKYLSNSTVGEYLECSARAEDKRLGLYKEPKFKLPFAIGHYFESLLNEDSERIEETEEFKALMLNKADKNGNRKQNASAALCHTMYNRCKENKLFMRFNTGENEKIFTGEIHGVLFKCKVDVVNIEGGYFTDTKSTKASLKPYDDDGNIVLDKNAFDWKDGVGKVPFYEHFDYIQQLAIYQELIFQNTEKKLQPILNACSKVKPHRFQTLFIGKDDFRLEDKLINLEDHIKFINSVRLGEIETTRCEKSTCEYCNSTYNPVLPIVI